MSNPPEGSVIDRRTLNRSLLARQLLLERGDATPVELVERLVGLQAQVPLDPYVGLWSRLREFDPIELGGLLLDRRAVRMTLLRSTLHLVTARDAAALRPIMQPVLVRAFGSSPFARQLGDLDLAPLLARGVELVEERPRTIAKLAGALAEEWPDHDPTSLAYAIRYLVPLVQITPRGVWGQSLQATVTTLSSWLGPTSVASLSVDELVLRYLRSFGPATLADIRTWSWLGELRPVVDRLRPQLRLYRDESGRDLYDVPDGLFADPASHAPVRFLPQFDNVFLSHADRSRLIDRVKWDSSFSHHGTFFVDGFLVGSWKLRRKGQEATLGVELRAPVTRPDRKEVGLEAESLLAFLAPAARARRLEITDR